MTARTVVITGASDGIGAVAARRLHEAGDTVVVVGRSPEKTRGVATALGVASVTADFARLDDVRDLAAHLLERYERIDVLANNAGGIFGDRTLTVDGNETTFQVNHLAPFLLTSLLKNRLIESNARVINTSSVAHARFAAFDIDDLQLEHGYSENRAYGNAKLANILFTTELHRRFGDQGLSAAAFHPGVVATNFADGSTTAMRHIYRSIFRVLLTTPEQGADTLVWLAQTMPGVDWYSGAYYVKRHLAKASPLAYNTALARELWEKSAALVGVSSTTPQRY
ncbi:NAD(P)-dependent dehydrogenase (short-subunit alcohol dehydrogenase family) [Okibacterium sp. HSC-33S16]|uniref:SDR family NAD(P)-dependent oxidoreductase n=1 Tax=Okibacterium sp. HSC-33S16 TaxID=2910965 RepID=UPI0020A17630|nr:SDR family NAD(P)-dependent oxidoreductase [Okibacterium sp. HSC-33S16]MCP2031305.1 NAD(P)-dependent dehydrogenase (short-subunit alcohol dehydrogenase family) [Okibacterium sp. HSC-33S16]